MIRIWTCSGQSVLVEYNPHLQNCIHTVERSVQSLMDCDCLRLPEIQKQTPKIVTNRIFQCPDNHIFQPVHKGIAD
jgi:hypothetical protein